MCKTSEKKKQDQDWKADEIVHEFHQDVSNQNQNSERESPKKHNIHVKHE